MFKHLFDNTPHIGYPEISLLGFFVFFIIIGIWAFRANKKYMDEMSRMPLDKDEHPADDLYNS
jgi:cbb3-type cytochrome oxidase subunit 3